jgi:hypothetical protein
MQRLRLLPALFLVLATGCVGTDIVDEPLSDTHDPRISITPSSASVVQGETVTFEATYYDETEQPVEGISFDWISSDPNVAAVDASGHAETYGPGQVIIQAMARDVTSPPAMLTIVADANAVARVVVQPDTVELEVGAIQTFTAIAYNVSGDVIDGLTVTWQSSNADVASMDADGRATALQPGTTEITAMADDVRSEPALLVVHGERRTGTFRRREGSGYMVQGTATLEQQPSGGLVLSFGDDFTSSSGPGLEVFLSTSNAVTATSFRVASLQSTSGAQSYTLSSDVGLNDYDWVIIHCVPFNVTFGYAELQ